MFLHGAGSQEDHPHLHEKLNFHESNCTHTLLHLYLLQCLQVFRFCKKRSMFNSRQFQGKVWRVLPATVYLWRPKVSTILLRGQDAKVSTILQDTLLGTNWWPTSKAPMCALIKLILIQYSQFNPRTPASEQCHFVFLVT